MNATLNTSFTKVESPLAGWTNGAEAWRQDVYTVEGAPETTVLQGFRRERVTFAPTRVEIESTAHRVLQVRLIGRSVSSGESGLLNLALPLPEWLRPIVAAHTSEHGLAAL